MNQKSVIEYRCPVCAQAEKGTLQLVREVWLVCTDCGRKYPIVGKIPVLLVPEGDRWLKSKVEDLPVPPPRPE